MRKKITLEEARTELKLEQQMVIQKTFKECSEDEKKESGKKTLTAMIGAYLHYWDFDEIFEDHTLYAAFNSVLHVAEKQSDGDYDKSMKDAAEMLREIFSDEIVQSMPDIGLLSHVYCMLGFLCYQASGDSENPVTDYLSWLQIWDKF